MAASESQVRPATSLTRATIGLLVGAGVLARLRLGAFNRSLWHDEARLANNVVEQSLVPLLTERLQGNQASPPGFLLLAKGVAATVGATDLALRLVPLCFGLLALPLACHVASLIFERSAPRSTFVGLV